MGTPDEIALTSALHAFLGACRLDVQTMKPGNVSVFSDGHGMTATQFMASADAAAGALFVRDACVGQRILDAVQRTRETVGCNTNLGIVLLVAPLAASLDEAGSTTDALAWRSATERVLARLDVDDARAAYRAIQLANPGGLGDAPEQSVQSGPTVGLKAAMALAAHRDSIARQYANGFHDIFDTGLSAARAWPRGSLAQTVMLDVFLTFLGQWPDSHIVRKHGETVAQSVTQQARQWHEQWRTAFPGPPDDVLRQHLLEWDRALKAQGLNPGTSADLAVTTLFVAQVLAPGQFACPTASA
jgi:triphosphoribosyl-dephospho-CoA synthase